MKSTNGHAETALEAIDNLTFMLLLPCTIFMIYIFQSIWDSISGLYFSHAYEAIVIPYFFYLLFTLKAWSDGKPVNLARHYLLFLALMTLLMPAAYLAMTGQVDPHTAIFGDFNPSLNHMPYASLLPFIFYFCLFTPFPRLKNLETEHEKLKS
jgi:hypothetical protein